MPKLWATTIETHRHEVRAAVLQAVEALVARQGLRGATMSAIAADAGIGRATLYKYFPDVDAILAAWHEEHVTAHVEQLRAVADGDGEPVDRLERVLSAYAEVKYRSGQHLPSGSPSWLHRGDGTHGEVERLRDVVAALISAAATGGYLRDDVPAAELAGFALSALTGAELLSSKAAVARLVHVTLDAMRR